jgi:DNA-binding transcriptional ArsR family regulator
VLAQALVRPVGVEVLGVLGEGRYGVPLAVEQQPVGALRADAARVPAAAAAVLMVPLSDPTRLRLLEFRLHDEHTVTECVARVGLAHGRVSTHLACLADCGHVQARRAGRHAFYRVADPRVADLVMLVHAVAADNCAALATCERIPPAGTEEANR